MSNLEALRQLVGAYLNEDWYLIYQEPWVAVAAFVRDEPEDAPLVSADIRRAVAESNSDSDLEDLLDKFGLGYDAVSAGWQSYQAWLLAVADRVDELLHKSPAA
jgi:contact-dependent growth inhibition (CDI) system CdiI-like immunity protein